MQEETEHATRRPVDTASVGTAAREYLTVAFETDASPQEAFDAITNVRGWWSSELEGDTTAIGHVFTYTYEDIHRSTQKVTELVPGRKVVWHVLDGYLNFTADPAEWTGTDIVFDITPCGDKTEVRLTHVGLDPEIECFAACSQGWGYYAGVSLPALIDGRPGNASAVIRRYIELVGTRDLDALEPLFADDFVATTGVGTYDKSEWMAALRRLMPILLRNDIRHTFENGPTAAVFYDFVTDTGAGAVPCAEWITVAGGAITTTELIFEKAEWPMVLEALQAHAGADR